MQYLVELDFIEDMVCLNKRKTYILPGPSHAMGMYYYAFMYDRWN